MDIKIITGLIGSAIAIGSLFVFQGQLINRVENLEAKSAPDINPIVQDISENTKNIAVLRKEIEQLREKNSNPLLR
tara:strand:+ start:897 stop:1124 length:228 start_codon:yes stop_codon:yes gene_type:complete